MDDEEFAEVLEDMAEGCAAHGKLNPANSKIIRPQHIESLRGVGELSVHVGHVFLEFHSIGDANAALQKMINRKYDGRFLKFISYEEDKFYSVVVPLQGV